MTKFHIVAVERATEVILDPHNRGILDTDWAYMVGSEQAWTQYEVEFNDWLDKYEASLG